MTILKAKNLTNARPNRISGVSIPPFSFALLAAVLFGAFNPLAKVIAGQVHWLAYGALVCAVSAALALLALAAFSTKVSFDSRRWHDYLGLGLVGLAVPIVLSGLAFSLAPSIHVGLLLRFEAFFAALYGVWLFKEKLSKWQLGGIGLGLLGALIFSTNGFSQVSWADVLVIVASAFYGTYLVFAKRLSDHDAMSLVAIRFCVAAAWLVPVAFLAGVMPANPPWLEIGVLSFFLFVMGTLAYTESVEMIGVSRTGAITQFFTGVFAIAAGAWWLGETFSALEWLSAALILVGGVIVVQARR
ncbi:DMT family transporter [Candidatus Micrarchaeota archaeon]|nr:DMT family transporter [Candidatus Micrarchaeota archaeon]